MKQKNVFSLVLTAMLALTLCIPALTVRANAAQAPLCVWGSLTQLDSGSLLLQNDSEDAVHSEIILHGENVLVLDAVTGDALSLDTIRDGSTVYAYIGPAMTRSLPPQATVHLILANLPADYAAPQYYQIQSVAPQMMVAIYPPPALTWTEFTTTGGVTLKITDDATLSRFQSEDAVRLEDLIPGTRLLVWSDSQGSPERVLVFPYAYEGYIASGDTGVVSVNGTALPQRAKTAGEHLSLLPVRAVAERLGLTVTWTADHKAVVSDGGSALLTFAPNDTEDICLVEEGVLYLDARTLARALNLFYAAG